MSKSVHRRQSAPRCCERHRRAGSATCPECESERLLASRHGLAVLMSWEPMLHTCLYVPWGDWMRFGASGDMHTLAQVAQNQSRSAYPSVLRCVQAAEDEWEFRQRCRRMMDAAM